MRIDPKTKLFADLTPDEARQMVAWCERVLAGEDDVLDAKGLATSQALDEEWCRLWSAHEGFADVGMLETLMGARPQRSFVARVLLSVVLNFPAHDLREENARLRAWVDDLQSRMYINCVYCGHRYGPEESTPMSMADVLTAHVQVCPKHPLSAAQAKIIELEAQLGIR